MCLAAMPTGRAQIRDDLAPVSLGTSAMRHDLPVTLQVFPSDKPASGHEPLTVRAMNRSYFNTSQTEARLMRTTGSRSTHAARSSNT